MPEAWRACGATQGLFRSHRLPASEQSVFTGYLLASQIPAPLHRLLNRLPEGLQKQPPIIVALENVLSPVTSVT
jgi:hypothetical protein